MRQKKERERERKLKSHDLRCGLETAVPILEEDDVDYIHGR